MKLRRALWDPRPNRFIWPFLFYPPCLHFGPWTLPHGIRPMVSVTKMQDLRQRAVYCSAQRRTLRAKVDLADPNNMSQLPRVNAPPHGHHYETVWHAVGARIAINTIWDSGAGVTSLSQACAPGISNWQVQSPDNLRSNMGIRAPLHGLGRTPPLRSTDFCKRAAVRLIQHAVPH